MLSKAAEQWQFAEGTAAGGFSAKQQKAFCSILQRTDQKKRASCDKLPDSKGTLGCAVQPIRKTVSNKVFSLMQLYGLRMKCGTKLQRPLTTAG